MNWLLHDLTPVRILLDASAGLVIVAIHGFLLALAARAMGDAGPAHDGRLTLNPMAHVDIFAMAGFVVAQLGWIRPMDLRTRELRGGVAGMVAVVLLALAGTWLAGQGAMAGRGLLIAVMPPDFLQTSEAWLFTFTRLSERFALFNLLPVLALTAAHVLRERLPEVLRLPGPVLSGLTLVLASVAKIGGWR